MEEWQKQMQEYLTDPRVAELMTDYYAKFQNQIRNVANSASGATASSNNASANPDGSSQLDERVANLEQRIKILEQLLGGMFK